MSGIVLFAKPTGATSFSSLFAIKRALKTKKVGHTGTLDSFADGLLVVLSNSLTRMVSHITDFDKTYEAIIKFGEETDTLEPTGNIIKTSSLPTDTDFFTILLKFQGEMEQIPPLFSALHINGKRASDIARSGKSVEIPSRKITIHSLEVLDVQMSCSPNLPSVKTENKFQGGGSEQNCEKCNCAVCQKYVSYVHIRVKVSKGTYIRSLARDIAAACGTCGHLIALRRLEVGPFKLQDAAGVDLLKPLSIPSAKIHLSEVKKLCSDLDNKKSGYKPTEEELLAEKKLQEEIINKIQNFTPELAKACGFFPVRLKSEYEFGYFSGKPLHRDMFFETSPDKKINQAVFTEDGHFAGVTAGRKYLYVVPRKKEEA